MEIFNSAQIEIVKNAVLMAEELVSNFYKMSNTQWLHQKYDVKTLSDLLPEEIVKGPFAQIIRYKGKHKNTTLESSTYDFYKICLQDHSILAVLKNRPEVMLFPFSIYIGTHELIHIVRFTKFLQSFEASQEEKMVEESRVHQETQDILRSLNISGMPIVFKYYKKWF